MQYKKIIKEAFQEIKSLPQKGEVASYIPELSRVNGDKFGIYFRGLENQQIKYGDFDEKFSIQSIAKVISLTMAYELEGDELWKRVGVEPSGTSFDSLIQLEHDNGIPRNPMINAGALVICDVLCGHYSHPKKKLLEFLEKLCPETAFSFNEKIANSEKKTSFKNAALINLMKSYNNIHNDIDLVLDFYFYLCSIELNCQELSKVFMYLANNGVNPHTNKTIINESKTKRINAIMQLCGFYDEAGEFAFKVGLPGKSGVGGGVFAIYPNNYCIALWSPRLNQKGNSYKTMKFLELFTTRTQFSIF